ncbi:MAG: HEAT repeat domain-containing protein [Woeseiaceae bacterium]
MNTISKVLVTTALLLAASVSAAQTDEEELKIAAMEALITAPPERALPIVQKVLAGNGSDELKEKALFILSQIDAEEAQTALLKAANESSGELRLEAVRMIGIGGNAETMKALAAIYESGDAELKEAVLEAYLIADDEEAIFQIANKAEDPDEFENAVEMLGAMHATEKLAQLRANKGVSEGLITAFMIAGDEETLLEMYRSSDDVDEKREIMEMLVAMDAEGIWDIIDQALGDE